MAFQCRAADRPQRGSTSFGSSSVSVSTTGSGDAEGEAEAEAEVDAEAGVADVTSPDQVIAGAQEAAASQDADSAGCGGGGEGGGGGGGCRGPSDGQSTGRAAAEQQGEAPQLEAPGAAPPPRRPSLEAPAAVFFPHLPPELLAELREPPSDQDIENRFTAISIAFKTDKLTLEERVALQKRWRDQAELNMIQEENNLRAAIQNLSHLCKDSTSIEIVTKVKEQVDILRMAVDWVARSSESLGAIQQESRVSKAVEVMLQYVENLKRIQGKQDEEGKKRSKNQSDDLTDAEETVARTVRLRSLQALPGMVKTGSKRRASIAAIPRTAANYIEPSRASISISPLYMDGGSASPRLLSRSGSFPRRTSLTPSAAPSSPSTTSWGSSENLDAFENTTNTFMDNIQEISESRRESCSSRLELENVEPEGNNNYGLKHPCCDDADRTTTPDAEPIKNVSVLKQMYLNYDKYMNAVEAARYAVMDYLDTDNMMFVARRILASLLVLAAVYYLIAMFFEPAEAVRTAQSQRTSSSSADKLGDLC
ncbi:inositol 1,4,5-triphosphate receptor associated 2-like isoform X1 [Schistocerca serialis cubense]|uniref:inositol 1,4,5-triphosphate receptor associated 2-like isoform X1 n=1 Tax=Schistocerca serialis cubense TaxID=2023355 RepID=UPI00214ECFED|nr:inositol 1,4,5-triphosphate receptor associated 2-like isoform X1 [Schistocerca serialis cubense]